MTASLANNSQLVYRNALTAFASFRRDYRLPLFMPASIDHVTLFISYCFDQGYAPTTIVTYMSGISFYHKIHNWEDPTDVFIVKKLLEGCKRMRRRTDVRAPINDTVLKRICFVLPTICFSMYEAALFKAAYLLAYFGLLRVSEIVFTNLTQANRPLLKSDIRIEKGLTALLVSIRISKTNQTGPTTTLRIPAAADNSNFCCVTAVKNYLTLRPTGAQYFFCHADSSPLTRSQFSGVLSKAIRIMGLPTQLYLSHSFRIGRATMLAAQGVSHESIKKLGRWKSDVVERYIRL